MPSHSHDDACVVLVLSGSVAHTQGNCRMVLESGSALYIPPTARHADVFSHSGARCIVNRIDPRWIRSRSLAVDLDGVSPQVTRDSQLYALGIAIQREMTNPDDLSPLIVEGALLELLGKWRRSERRGTVRGPAWLERVRVALLDTFQTSVSLSDLSKIAGAHPAHVARTFRRVHGATVGAYVRQLRVEFVAERLRASHGEPRSQLAALALEAGFSSHAHMAFAFKQRTGLTPSEYRKAHRPASRG